MNREEVVKLWADLRTPGKASDVSAEGLGFNEAARDMMEQAQLGAWRWLDADDLPGEWESEQT